MGAVKKQSVRRLRVETMIKRGGFNEKQAVYRGTVNGLNVCCIGKRWLEKFAEPAFHSSENRTEQICFRFAGREFT